MQKTKTRAEIISEDWRRASPREKRRIKAVYARARAMTEARRQPFHVDHIIPLARGGRHQADNLQILTAKKNLAKGVRIGYCRGIRLEEPERRKPGPKPKIRVFDPNNPKCMRGLIDNWAVTPPTLEYLLS